MLKKIVVFLLFFLFFAFLNFSEGKIYRIGKYDVLYLKGNPYEIGYYYGKTLSNEFKNIIKRYKKLKGEYFKDYFLIAQPYFKFTFNFKEKKLIKKIPQRYRKELKGISVGAQLSLDEIESLNIFYEFLYNSCSSFAYKRYKNFYFGRNLDGSAGLKQLSKNSLIMVVFPDNGYKYIGFTLKGLSTFFTGVNENGIIVSINKVPEERKSHNKLPALFLMKLILEKSKNLKDAEDILKNNLPSSGEILTIASLKSKEAIAFEIKGENYIKRVLKNNYLISTNHFLKAEKSNADISFSSSKKRFYSIEKDLENRKKPILVLQSHEDPSTGVDVVYEEAVNNIKTIQSILFYKNGDIIFSSGESFAPSREKIVFNTKEFFNLKIKAKRVLEGKLSLQENLYLNYLKKLKKIKKSEEILKALKETYRRKKFFEYYYEKTKYHIKKGEEKKALNTILEAKKKNLINDELIYFEGKIYLKKKECSLAKRILIELTEIDRGFGYSTRFERDFIKSGCHEK